MLADIAAVKLVSLLGAIIPAGTFVYAVTFTVRDALHRRYGIQAARVTIWAAAAVNVAMALYFMLTIWMPAPPYWGTQEAYAMVLGVVPSIVVSSIIAELLSELLDTEIYQIAWNTFAKNHHWLRVVVSNLISVPVDSIIFAGLAFVVWPLISKGEPLTWAAFASMVIGQTLFKWVVSLAVLPITSSITPGN
jgi:hypothetical protein